MNKKLSRWHQLKNYCVDKLWFVILLTPLLVIATIITQYYQSTTKQTGASRMVMVVGAVEISKHELVAILAKPLTELIAMEVYPDLTASALIASTDNLEQLRPDTSNRLSEITQVQYSSIKTIA